MAKNILTLLGGIACLLATSCTSTSNSKEPEKSVYISKDTIRSGDLICRLGDGLFSDVFKQFSGGDNRFSHIGIVHCQDSVYYVIHSEASETTGIGGVIMDSISNFINHSLDYQIYRVANDTIRQRIDSVAYSYYQKNTPFDLSFDLSSDSALYCSELVAISINKATGDPHRVPTFPFPKIGQYYRIADILECGIIE